jgi:serine/threonine protein kinase/tetratricopeptide (TPR) repeat protein
MVGTDIEGRYRIVRQLGEGGMGVVYLATQIQIERSVAVKVVREDIASDSRTVRRFLAEARACSALHHPNVVTVHDFGRTETGILYLVMEYLAGHSLSHWLALGPMSAAQAAGLGVQICSGLQAAHGAGIIHRDLKPDNVMLCQAEGFGNLVKLLDFGIARSLRSEGGTEPGMVIGTPEYMSPEQAFGKTLDARSDLYSLGILLYQMVCGRVPFDSEDPIAILVSHRQDPPPSMRGPGTPDLPAEFERLVLKLLSKDPADRPPSAEAVREALQSFLASTSHPPVVPVPAEPPSPRPPPVRSTDRGTTRDIEVGTVIGKRFRVDAILRDGPVLEANGVDLASDHDRVAIRRLVLPGGTDRADVDFAIERWISMLRHFGDPRIASLKDLSWMGGNLVLVTEAVDGVPLSRRLKTGGRMEPAEAMRTAIGICDALAALHGVGVLHLDVRPHTVVSTDRGPVLLDPGIWALADTGLPLAEGQDLNAIRAMKAPEQLGLLSAGPGPESDLYGLGCLLYQALADRPPFPADDGASLSRVKLGPPPPPTGRFFDGIPADLDRLILRLLHPVPVERPRSAAAVSAELRRIAGGTTRTDPEGRGLDDLDAEGRVHGREAERSLLRTAVESVSAGRGSAVALRGPAGVGKSRLVAEAEFELKRGNVLSLRTKGLPPESSQAYRVIRRLLMDLGEVLELEDPAVRERTFGRIDAAIGPMGGLLRPFAPWLERRYADAELPPELEGDAAHGRLIRAIGAVFVGLSREDRPLCLVLDDLQWMDKASLDVIEALGRAVSRFPLMLLIATRPTGPDEPASRTLDALAAEGGRILELPGLPADSVRSFLAERLGPVDGLSDLASAVHRLTDGNPAAMRETLVQAEDAGVLGRGRDGTWRIHTERLSELKPASGVVERMLGRVFGLGDAGRAIMPVVAVWGEGIDLATLRALRPGMRDDALVAALVEAERAGILAVRRQDRGIFAVFSHDALREAVLAAVPESLVQSLHRVVAAHLGANPAADPARVAEHLLLAGPDASDLKWLLQAAMQSVSAFDGEAGRRFAAAALDLMDPITHRERYLKCVATEAKGLLLGRRIQEAMQRYEHLLTLEPDRDLRVEALKDLSSARRLLGEIGQAIARLDEALGLLDWHRPRTRAGRLVRTARLLAGEVFVATRGAVKAPKGEIDERRRKVTELLLTRAVILFFTDPVEAFSTVIDALHEGRLSRSAAAWALALASSATVFGAGIGWVRTGIRLGSLARRLSESSGDALAQASARAYEVAGRTDVESYDGVFAEEEASRRIVDTVGDAWLCGIYEEFLTEARFDRGELYRGCMGAVRIDEALAVGQYRKWFAFWTLSLGTWVAIQIGRWDLARIGVDRGLESEVAREDTMTRALFHARRAVVAAHGDRPAAAWDEARIFLDYVAKNPGSRRYIAHGAVWMLEGLLDAALAEGLDGPRSKVLEDALALSRRKARGFPTCVRDVAVAQARFALLRNDPGQARSALAPVIAALERTPDASGLSVAAAWHLAGVVEGGTASTLGRERLERAWKALRFADDALKLKREVATALGRPLDASADIHRIESQVHRILGLPPPARLGPTTSQTTKAANWVAVDRISEVIGALTALLQRPANERLPGAGLAPLVSATGADRGFLFVHEPLTDRLVMHASHPDGTPSPHALSLCRSALSAGNALAEDIPSGSGGAAGSAMAVPHPPGTQARVVMYLENTSVPGAFDASAVRTVCAAMPLVELAGNA